MRKIIIDTTVYIFIVIFLYTGLSKIVDFNVFVVTLGVSPVAKNYAQFIAVAVPVSELIIVALLLVPRTRRIGLLSSLVLMVIFTAYVAIILGANQKLPCSCGGIFYKITWKPHLLLNIFLTLLAGLSLYFMKRERDLKLLAH